MGQSSQTFPRSRQIMGGLLWQARINQTHTGIEQIQSPHALHPRIKVGLAGGILIMQLNLLLSHLISSQRSSVLLLILVSVSVSSDDFFLFFVCATDVSSQ